MASPHVIVISLVPTELVSLTDCIAVSSVTCAMATVVILSSPSLNELSSSCELGSLIDVAMRLVVELPRCCWLPLQLLQFVARVASPTLHVPPFSFSTFTQMDSIKYE